jgi:mono/diheme cytochrome c family protein
MSATTRLSILILVLGVFSGRAIPADAADASLDRTFAETVRPFLASYCTGCHGGEKPMAQFDLKQYSNLASVVQDHRHWALVAERLTAKTMPPQQAKQPDPADRQKVVEWIGAMLKNEARKTAGDPGVVLARRLSNAEYNYTVRDLTGVDIRPTREFPVDPANPAGFDNSGESLAMSPSLLNKYLQAAREVANHMVLNPSGIAFAPHLVLVETDRDKYCVGRIIDFYHQQDTDFSDYFQAAWRYKNRAALGKPRATLASLAAESRVSPKYLATIWHTLEETKEEIGPLAKLQSIWRELPAPKGNQPDAARDGSNRMRDYVVQLRKKLETRWPDLAVTGISRTAQPFLMYRNRQYATHRTSFDKSILQVEGEYKPPQDEAPAKKATTDADNADEANASAAPMKRLGPDADLHVPAGQRAAYEAAFTRFAAVFPDAFYVSERGRYFPDNTRDTGRHLSAGFHNLMGYFRDDQPLYQMILDVKQQKQLDEMWQELDFVASANIRTYVQFYLFETREASKAGDGGAPAAEDKDITSEARIRKVEESYLARARASKNEIAIKAVEDHFKWVDDGIRWVEKARLAAEPKHLDALVNFASRAYRRPLSAAERTDLLAYYKTLREKDGLSHEDAMRDSVVSVLMSPDFCYRIDLVEAGGRPSGITLAAQQTGRTTAAIPAGARPLPDYALASRLSYFLWSSMPDDELLARAAAGDLHRPDVIAAQARRMLKDDRAQGLAAEFGGNWLDIRRFEEHNAVDRERFPTFTNELRQAMFEEPIRFIEDVIRNNHSILDFVFANYTWVNPVLAKHYGMEDIAAKPNEWVKVENAGRYERGGLLPMAAFLTKNAPGLRTSPVKRGYWVVRRVLGEQIPPPPAVVPELPRDEAKMDLPLRDMLAKHREDPSCAACHARFDSFGLALEGYGPVGERRTKDLAGRAVDVRAAFPGGAEGSGLEGVRTYIRAHRQNDFVDAMCRKLTVYALGRSLMLSDEPAIEAMRTKLAANGYRFHTMVEQIVTSPQFLTKRGPEAPTQRGE